MGHPALRPGLGMKIMREPSDTAALDRALGERLAASGKIDAAGLERGLRLQQASGERLHIVLAKLGLVSERDIATAMSEEFGIPLVGPGEYPDEPILPDLSLQFMKEARVVPLADAPDQLTVALADPLNGFTVRGMEFVAGKPIKVRLATPSEIESVLERLHSRGGSSLERIVEGMEERDDDTIEDVERLRDLASEAPVIRLVNLLISRAVEARASDIHLETFEGHMAVRYRVDGVLREVEGPPARLRAAIVSRVKIMAKLNIAERRLPQDGRIKLAVRGKDIDLRVSVIPMMHGEGVVLRILDRDSVRLDLAALGLAGERASAFTRMLDQPHGIVLVTGPTGSGKTTTLYASLVRLNTPDRKIVTVEDPIEYQLSGVNQIQTRPQIGLNFAQVLRSVLRHDPDVIMIGEIRDRETAEIAVQAALTGHVVLSTLHTNDAASAATRLLDMGVADYLLTSTINGVAAQRLVRTICPECREEYAPLAEFAAHLGLADGSDRPPPLYRGRGCNKCLGTGYFGRTSIMEVMPMSDGIRRLVLNHADARDIQAAAVAEGMITLYADGMRKALAGETTVDEVLRVTRRQ
jgi:general secretion pathway protein E